MSSKNDKDEYLKWRAQVNNQRSWPTLINPAALFHSAYSSTHPTPGAARYLKFLNQSNK